LLALSSTCYVVFSGRDYKNDLVKYGQIEKNRIESQKGNRIELMKGKQIVIYKDDYDALTDELKVNGTDEEQAKKDAEKILLREEALYIIAK